METTIPLFLKITVPVNENEINEFFSPGGQLAAALPGFESRPQQLEMALEAAESINRQKHLIVEAGTGVGKSLAYLLPAYLNARQTQKPVVVSTYTINLQEQLLRKDIPLLETAIGTEIKAAAAVGRGNYLCLRRLGTVQKMQPDLFEQSFGTGEFEKIYDWAFRTEEGSLSDLDFSPRRELWEQINSSRYTCRGKNCATYEACFFRKARQRLRQAQIIIANHYLYFSDLAIPDPNLKAMPLHSFVIFDEAHTLEEVASECLGLKVSRQAIMFLLQKISGDAKHRGLLQGHADSELIQNARKLHTETENFFQHVREWAATEAPGNMRIMKPLPVEDTMSTQLTQVGNEIMRTASAIEDEDIASELAGCATEILECAIQAKTIRSVALEGYVYWVEEEKKDISLRGSPIRVSGLLSQLLFSQMPSVILTGATLSVGKEEPFAFIRERLGLGGIREALLGSPFNYSNQATIYIERKLPSRESEDHIPAISHAIKHYLEESRGRALVLFTSYGRMQAVFKRIAPFLEEKGYLALMQGSGTPRGKLLENFKNETESVLFGTSSFWQGVDVPGESLSCVIIVQLPFAVPTTPLQQARMEEVQSHGKDSFLSYSLPQAVIRLKQGVGRLIRTKTDKGSIVILDSRIATRRYGRIFIESLPSCEIQIRD